MKARPDGRAFCLNRKNVYVCIHIIFMKGTITKGTIFAIVVFTIISCTVNEDMDTFDGFEDKKDVSFDVV